MLLVLLLALMFLTELVVYFCIAAVLAIIGRPVVAVLHRLHFGRFRLPLAVCAILTLVVMLGMLLGIMLFFFPRLYALAEQLGRLDYEQLGLVLEGPLSAYEAFVHRINPNIEARALLKDYLVTHIQSLLNFELLSSVIDSAVGVTSTFLVGLFAVCFMGYFFLYDQNMVQRIFYAATPDDKEEALGRVLDSVSYLLKRYFLGLVAQLAIIILLVGLGLSLLGLPNAWLIALFCGVANVIPYLGPILGILFGLALTLINAVDSGAMDVLPSMLKFLGVAFAVQVVDNVFTQPFIFSNSVKAHPLEIFVVILAAGKLGGIPGMLIAVPLYTVIRVVAKEFFSQHKIVSHLTRNL
jgi:predicted PurR-regulated permease PerM